MRKDCPFCERIRLGDYDTADRYNVAFEPLNPVAPGHFLVVSRAHAEHAIAAPSHAGRAMKFAAMLAAVTGIGSANFITSAGVPATQSVFHLHVHVVPREDGDGLALPWTGQARAAGGKMARALDDLSRVPRARQALDFRELRLIARARDAGASWQQIAERTGYRGRQGAQLRYKTLLERVSAGTVMRGKS